MIITFCGHSSFTTNEEYEKRMLEILEEKIGDAPAELFLGGYGFFDDFAYRCGKKYQATHPKTKLIFITPYITLEYQKNHLKLNSEKYDSTIYPNLEHVPLKFAISHRNRWMVDNSNVIIAYVRHNWGGAFSMLKYAQKRGLQIINIAEERK